MKSSALAMRRDRRILRSKVYLLLKESSKDDKYFNILEQNLNKKELEDVFEDAFYFVPFPDKLQQIMQHSLTMEQLVDNIPVKIKYNEPQKPIKKQRRPSLLLPIQRNPSFTSTYTIKPKITLQSPESISKAIIEMKRILNRIDISKPLLNKKENKIRSKSENKIRIYKAFHDQFYKIDTEYHLELKRKKAIENWRNNRTVHWKTGSKNTSEGGDGTVVLNKKSSQGKKYTISVG